MKRREDSGRILGKLGKLGRDLGELKTRALVPTAIALPQCISNDEMNIGFST